MSLMGAKNYKYLNKRVTRIDAIDKITGRAVYAADVKFPDMLYSGCLRSPYAYAKIVRIDTVKAKAIKGVHAVLTAEDVPKPISWAGYPYLCDGTVKYIGETVAIVAAETMELVEDALKTIEVEYVELDGVFTIEDALKEDAVQIKENGVGLKDGVPCKDVKGNIFYDSYFAVRKGDVEKGFSEADTIFEREYRTSYVEHSYIEPEACVVLEDPAGGGVTAHASAQNPFFTRRYLADALQAPINKCRVIQRVLGGSFGGKEELVGMIVGRTALLAVAAGRPVKMVMTREESFLESAKRHPFHFKYKAGLTKDGKIIAWEGTQIDNSGAYNNQTQFMNCRAAIHSAGAYNIPNIKTDTYGVFTNNIHSGAMRGYSSPQIIFAQEQFLNEIAKEMGIDDVELRKKNILKQGDLTATSQKLVKETITLEMIDYMVEKTAYYRKKAEYAETHDSKEKRKGIALVSCYRGCGYGAETPDAGAALCTAMEDGSILINSGLAENGQGLKTAYAQIAAEGIGCTPDVINFVGLDTHSIPDSGMTVASRGTVMGAQSMRKASIELGDMLRKTAAQMLDVKPAEVDIENNEYFIIESDRSNKVSLADVCNTRLWTGKSLAAFNWSEPGNLGIDHHTGQGDAFPTYSYGVIVAEVEVDMETGFVDVLKVTAGHDVGTCINPDTSEGQIYGGIAMGQGFGVTEEVSVKNGMLDSKNFDSYIFPTSMDVPEMEAVIFECEDNAGTYGAKSLGEPATEAVGAAIAAAIADATGKPVRELPCNLERVLLGRALK
ncbi:MAG: xanthine dehydrogenase family protein [Bacteroidetes bacterium]|nr:xanthine dehydrogenase family protein [Bacteroidota bacterium]